METFLTLRCTMVQRVHAAAGVLPRTCRRSSPKTCSLLVASHGKQTKRTYCHDGSSMEYKLVGRSLDIIICSHRDVKHPGGTILLI